MSKQPASETSADTKTRNGNQAPTPGVTKDSVDTSVDTENPNDAIEAYHERLRERFPKD